MRKESDKRDLLIAVVFAVLFVMTVSTITIQADVSWPSVSSGKYCEFTASKTIYVYRNTSCTIRGTSSPAKSYNASIARNDVCYIYKFTNNYLQVNYPTSSGRRTGYIKRSDFVVSAGITQPKTYCKAKGKATTYKYVGGASYGYTEVGDDLYELGTSGTYTAIIYSAKSGKRAYKYAFVKTSDYTKITKTGEADNYVTPANGLYSIASSINTGKVLDVSGANTDDGTNVCLWDEHNGKNQQFNVISQNDGWYIIKDSNSGKALDVDGASKESGANVHIWSLNYTDAQLWKFYSAGNGSYYIKSKCGNYLDLTSANTDNGTNIQVYAGNETAAQKWVLKAVKADNNVSSDWQMPMTDAYVCGNNWLTYYRARPSRPYHMGLDLASKQGDSNVYAAASGKIAAVGRNSANGKFVVIEHSINGKTVYSFYCHLNSYCVTKGKSINKGTKLGVFGNTGSASMGAHLHFAIIDKLYNGGGYYGYGTAKSGDKVSYSGATYYNPFYVVKNGKLP